MSPENPQDPQKGKPFEDVQASEDAKEAAELKAEVDAQQAEQPEPNEAEGGTPSAEGTAAGETGVDKAAADALSATGEGADEEPLAAPGDDDPAAADEADEADEVVAGEDAVDPDMTDDQQERA